MQTAHAEAFAPRRHRGGALIADAPGGRGVWLIFRGTRNGWEVVPDDGGREVRLGPLLGDPPLAGSSCVCVRPPFWGAAHFALQWLRGAELPAILAQFEFVGGRPAGLVRRG